MDKVACADCGAEILPSTSKRNHGLCAKCNKPSKKVGIVISITMGLAFLLIGFWLLSNQENVKADGIASRNWPSTKGVVSEIFFRERDLPTINYTYSVKGVEYTGDRITFGSNNDWSSSGDVGDNVAVYYDEDDPKTCILMTGFLGKSHETMWYWFDIGFVVMGCLGLARGLLSLLSPTEKGFNKRR
jgi:hypothetical protein